MLRMLNIVNVTFPFFALVLAGFVATRRGWLALDAIPAMNAFVLYFALPCMLFRFGASTPIARMLDPAVIGSYLGCALLIVAVAVVLTRRGAVGWNDAAFGSLVAAFPNSGFMGVPLLVDLLGPAAAAPAIVAVMVDMVVTSSLCIALSRLGTAGEHGMREALSKSLRGVAANPLPWAIVFGALVSATGLELPPVVFKPVAMLADAASPVALFTLGAVLARSQMRPDPEVAGGTAAARRADVPLVVGLKLIAHPLLVWGVGSLAMALGLPLEPFALQVLVLLAALPSASNVTMLAERYGADSGRIARIVLISTALSFLTFTVAVAWLV